MSWVSSRAGRIVMEGSLELAAEGLVQQGLFQRVECGELALVDGFEALNFF